MFTNYTTCDAKKKHGFAVSHHTTYISWKGKYKLDKSGCARDGCISSTHSFGKSMWHGPGRPEDAILKASWKAHSPTPCMSCMLPVPPRLQPMAIGWNPSKPKQRKRLNQKYQFRKGVWHRLSLSQRPARNSTSCTSGWFQLQGTPHHRKVNRSCLCLKLSEYIWDGTNLPCWNSFSRPLGTALSVCHIRTVNILKLSTRTGCQPRTLCHWDTQRHSKTPRIGDIFQISKRTDFRASYQCFVSCCITLYRWVCCMIGAPGVRTPIGTGGCIGRDEKILWGKEANCIWRGACHQLWPAARPELHHGLSSTSSDDLTKPRSSAWAGAASLGLQKVWKVCRICITESR